MKRTGPSFVWLVSVLLFSLLLNSCGNEAGLPAPPTALPAAPTSTPAPPSTSTPQPTSTPTSSPTSPPTATVTLPPTETPDRAATNAARQMATSEALVYPRLEKYGISPAEGHIAWVGRQPIRLELTSYMENGDHVLEDIGSVSDFVIESKVTWDTSGALSLCGITFHAEEDLAQGAQNRFFIMRLQYSPGWTIWHWNYGQFQHFVSDRWQISPDIHDDNHSYNRLALVVRGKDIDIFINGDKQRQVEDTKLEEGLLALSANQESGRTVCTFEDTWVWVFDP